jgi:hypothetical protein
MSGVFNDLLQMFLFMTELFTYFIIMIIIMFLHGSFFLLSSQRVRQPVDTRCKRVAWVLLDLPLPRPRLPLRGR